MTAEKCTCGGKASGKGSCAACLLEQEPMGYWCQTCNRPAADKRCPLCGLKTQRKKSGAPGPTK